MKFIIYINVVIVSIGYFLPYNFILNNDDTKDITFKIETVYAKNYL